MTAIKYTPQAVDTVSMKKEMMQNPQNTFRQTKITTDSFWGRRRHAARTAMIQHQLKMLKETGRYDCHVPGFWHGSFENKPSTHHNFWDSDLAKWIEGVCYLLQDESVEALRSAGMEDEGLKTIESAVDELIERFRGAQASDGYLNLHYQVVDKGMKWTNLRDMHELYNAGHLIEAALAHHHLYKNDKLLAPILKYVDLICKTFGDQPGQLRGYPGHSEIELALIRLYRFTGNEEHLRLVTFFIEERGNTEGVEGHYYALESKRRGNLQQSPYSGSLEPYSYQQAHLPITAQPTIEGHSVRAMYLLTGVADLCLISPSAKTKYLESLHRLWDNMVHKKMYLTGGIGAMDQWEGFGIDYFLPQSTDEGGCYNETCAAIGVVMLAERLLQLELDGKYADILELVLYNALLTGMSHDGKSFTYVNQLATSKNNLSQRYEWFDCPCCPPNVLRFLGSLGGYVWHHTQMGPQALDVNVLLYMDSKLEVDVDARKVVLRQKTQWPLDGRVEFELDGEDVDVTLRLRIPAWAEQWEITPAPPSTQLHLGFLTLDTTYLRHHPTFTLDIKMTPRLIRPHPYTNQPIVAVARGPIVYCVEDVDNDWVDDHFKSIIFNPNSPLTPIPRTDIFPHSDNETVIGITAKDSATFLPDELNTTDPVKGTPTRGVAEASSGAAVAVASSGPKKDLHFIPYYARANRSEKSKGMMRVGLRVL